MNSMKQFIIVLLLCVLMSTLMIEIQANEFVSKLKFKRSNFFIVIEKENSIKYLVKLFNGEKFLQNIHIDLAYMNQNFTASSFDNAIMFYAADGSFVAQFNTLIDVEGFSSLAIIRRLKKFDKATDCIDLEPGQMNWYGGPEVKLQLYPIQKMTFNDLPYVKSDGIGVMERLWLNSRGVFLYIDIINPLTISQNANQMCYTAKNCPQSQDDYFTTSSVYGFSTDVKKAQISYLDRFTYQKPKQLPNERLIRYPIWNTWVRYGRNFSEKTIQDFASEISMNQFNNSMMVIDDFWEEKCYGSMTIDKSKFPNMKAMITDLKTKYNGTAFSLWIHPFINKNCDPYYTNAKDKNYLIKSSAGTLDTSWWDSTLNGAGFIDFSNPNAKAWFESQLVNLRSETGIEHFKFVGGESNFLPAVSHKFSIHYKSLTEKFDATTSKMIGFNSRWTQDNGLQALVPKLLQLSLSGSSFILPDVVGGNRYGEDITKELFIRWLQANVFMSSIQFSVTPWDFDDETVAIARKFTKLHLDYSDFIYDRLKLKIQRGDPVNLPIWWLDPEDKDAQTVDDEFLLGETILSAPVVGKGRIDRDIYLPIGYWKDGNNGQMHDGKKWIRNYPAPHDVLPYFIKQYNRSEIVIDTGDKSNYLIKQIYFKRSAVSASIQKRISDGKYYVKIFNANKFVQSVSLSTNFGNQLLEIVEISNGYELFATDNSVRISISIDFDVEDFSVVKIERKMNQNDVATDCFDLEPANMNWYGGTTEKGSDYPIQKLTYTMPYIPLTTSYSERYWFNSRGISIFVDSDVPLFVDQNINQANHICFTAKNDVPYPTLSAFNFIYKIGFSSNARKTQINAMSHFFNIPKSHPKESLLEFPFWGTQNKFQNNIDENKLQTYVNDIIMFGYNIGMLMIDSGWETCTGSMIVNKVKFPNLKNFVTKLREKVKDLIIQLYISPIIDPNCKTEFEFAQKNNYFVKSNVIGEIDFSNPNAALWIKNRLETLKAETGADGFKFSIGGNIYFPGITEFQTTSVFATTAGTIFKDTINFEVGWKKQNREMISSINIFTGDWKLEHGIKSLIPRMLHMNMIGYSYITNECSDSIPKEIYIRWVQALTFMPHMQMCKSPWDSDQEMKDIIWKSAKLHTYYFPLIKERYWLKSCTADPVNPPIWWLDPEDKDAQMVSDEYLLGETILVAPVVEVGKIERDIYLPIGTWKDGNTGIMYHGKTWLRKFPAPLAVLPHFFRQLNVASVVHDFVPDKLIQQIDFKKSNCSIKIQKRNSDKMIILNVFHENTLVQNIKLGSIFGDKAVKVSKIPNGYEISGDYNLTHISFTIEIDNKDFSVLNIRRNLTKREVATDCFELESSNMNWYGGPQQKNQSYPIQSFKFKDFAYIPKDLNSATIMERYWLSSRGFFVFIDYDVPLFVDQNTLVTDHICYTARKALPYYTHKNQFTFNYKIGFSSSPRTTHINVINRIMSKPSGIPSEKLVRYPIWNTWVRYGRSINEQHIRDLAKEISRNGFNSSLLDIDDSWEETCYGSTLINKMQFPNMKKLTTDVKSLLKGVSIVMWVHPFINKNCEPYYKYAKNNGYLTKSISGSYDTSWWNSGTNGAAHVDFTNPIATIWYKNKLKALQNDHGIDSFKFDAGEASFYPIDSNFSGNSNLFPSLGVSNYVRMASLFGNLLEVKTGWGTQDLKVMVRMMDFDSRWEWNNGLISLIPTLIQMNLNGYPFVIPDMIGGNRYGDKIRKELFIRWMQATVFMPAMQFSVTPWDFDQETIDISLKYTKLHLDYSDLILERFNVAVNKGDPVNPPIWWLDPKDKTAQIIHDEFLLGETILAAPVVEQGKVQRDIYLPVGTWKDGNSDRIYEGKRWLRKYSAPLGVLPYFIKQ